MITSVRRQWILTVLTFAAPAVGIAAVRHFTGLSHPASASADAVKSDTDFGDDGFETAVIPRRPGAVPAAEAPVIVASAAGQAEAWSAPMFPAPAIEPADMGPVDGASESNVPVTAPVLAPGAAAYVDRFVVSSLMAARNGGIAVIDRKLRRVGDAVGSGVVVESIDLEARVVVLRTPDGVMLTRRTDR